MDTRASIDSRAVTEASLLLAVRHCSSANATLFEFCEARSPEIRSSRSAASGHEAEAQRHPPGLDEPVLHPHRPVLRAPQGHEATEVGLDVRARLVADGDRAFVDDRRRLGALDEVAVPVGL